METRSMTDKIAELVSILAGFTILLVKLIIYSAESLYNGLFPAPQKSVKDELTLITGAGHGIGRELALQLSALGSRVALWDMDLTRCEQTAKEVRALGGTAQAFKCDVSDRAEVLRVAEETRNLMGDVNILINNAGIMPCKEFLSTPESDIRKQFEVNVLAHCWTMEAFLPSMKADGRGHIVAISSMAGILGLVNLVPYCATKFAVRGLMEAMSEEIRMDPKKPEIKFTTVYPFIVNTGLVHKPRIRYPSLLGIVSPRDAASEIINAMRREVQERTIPAPLLYLNNFCRVLPTKLAYDVRDMIDSGCEAHD